MKIPQITTNFHSIDELLYMGYIPTVLHTAMDLGVFDTLAENSLNAGELSNTLNLNKHQTEAFAEVLVKLNLVEKDGERYSLPLMTKEYLVSSSPAYQKAMIDLTAQFDPVMEHMSEILQGKPTPMPENEHWSSYETVKNMGQSSFNGLLQNAIKFIMNLPEFPNFRQMCDLAGNHGFYTMALLDNNEQLHGTVYDMPNVVPAANQLIEDLGYSDRLQAVGKDLITDFPHEHTYDCVLTSHMLYAWKGRLEDIFTKIHAILNPGGIFVSNHLYQLEEDQSSVSDSLVELMARLAGYPSHHLSEAEITEALRASGFDNFTIEVKPEMRTLLLAARKS